MHFNTRSLLPKLSELRTLISDAKPAAVAISETWLDESVPDNEINIQGYTVLRRDRNRNGGGVCNYVHNDIAFNNQLDLQSDHLENLWLEILLPKTKPIFFGVYYRPPDDTTFLTFFEDSISKIRSDREMIIMGDIDHILTNNPEKICQSGTINVGLSDHLLIYCTRKAVRGQVGQHRVINIRSAKNYSKDIFLSKLSSINWSSVYKCTDVNHAWDLFSTTLLKIIDDVAPMKQIRERKQSQEQNLGWTIQFLKVFGQGTNFFMISRKTAQMLIFTNSTVESETKFKGILKELKLIILVVKLMSIKTTLKNFGNN